MKRAYGDSIEFAPSLVLVFGPMVAIPVIIVSCVAIFMGWAMAVTTLGVITFLVLSQLRSQKIFPYTLFIHGAFDRVRLTPEGILHEGWYYKPISYAYSWDEIHSLRIQQDSYAKQMIAFTPVRQEIGKFHRSAIDGTYGVPVFGSADEMLATMVDFHERYSTKQLPSAWDATRHEDIVERIKLDRLRNDGEFADAY